MANNKKIKLNKIAIIAIILFAILGSANKAFALPGFAHYESEDHPNGAVYHTPGWVGKNYSEGIIHATGGETKDGAEKTDDGSNAVGNDGGGGGAGANSGYSGTWNGGIDFPLSEVVFSPASSFKPHNGGDAGDFRNEESAFSNSVIWFQDLCNISTVLCTQRGTPLTGSGKFISYHKADGNFWDHDIAGIEPVKAYNVKEAEKAKDDIAAADPSDPRYEKYYRTACSYDSGTVIQADPKEAFVLSEASRAGGSSEKTPLQIAWWAIRGMGEDNELSRAAGEFASYIASVTSSDASTSRVDSNGNKRTGFAIKYDPEFEKTDLTSVFNTDEGKYIVGPYKINYNDKHPNFAGIYDFCVYTNYSKDEIDKNSYRIAVAKSGSGTNLKTLEEGKYPSSNEEFYIILDYNPENTVITNIKVKFKYQNANGSYTRYEGKFQKVFTKGEIYGEYDQEQYAKIEEARDNIKGCLNNQMFIFESDADQQILDHGYYNPRATKEYADEILHGYVEKFEQWGRRNVFGFLYIYTSLYE